MHCSNLDNTGHTYLIVVSAPAFYTLRFPLSLWIFSQSYELQMVIIQYSFWTNRQFSHKVKNTTPLLAETEPLFDVLFKDSPDTSKPADCRIFQNSATGLFHKSPDWYETWYAVINNRQIEKRDLTHRYREPSSTYFLMLMLMSGGCRGDVRDPSHS